MEIEREQEVRELAYQLWQEEGCPDGYDVQHWLKAEAISQEKYRPKNKPRRSKPLKKKEQKNFNS